MSCIPYETEIKALSNKTKFFTIYIIKRISACKIHAFRITASAF